VQPLPREAYSEQTLGATDIVPDMAGMTEQDWKAYETTIAIPASDPDRPFGAYAVTARKRRQGACPFHNSQTPASAPASADDQGP
jgi:hypothetical protein